MKCFRYSSFVLFALLGVFFGSFIINQNNTYAVNDISVSFHASDSVSQWAEVFPNCTTDCLNNYSYLIIDGAFDLSSWSSSTNYRFYIRFDGSTMKSFSVPIAVSFSIYKLPFDGHANNFIQFGSSFTFTSDVTFTLTESYQSGITPSGSLEITENGTYDVTNYAEAVVNVPETDCPSSSGGDYHEDLVAINNSIMICAATCLVIYFFYCIYRMIIKNSGVK